MRPLLYINAEASDSGGVSAYLTSISSHGRVVCKHTERNNSRSVIGLSSESLRGRSGIGVGRSDGTTAKTKLIRAVLGTGDRGARREESSLG